MRSLRPFNTEVSKQLCGKYIKDETGHIFHVTDVRITELVQLNGYHITLKGIGLAGLEMYSYVTLSNFIASFDSFMSSLLENVEILHNYEKILETDLMRALNGK
jgi:hypothetical protein